MSPQTVNQCRACALHRRPRIWLLVLINKRKYVLWIFKNVSRKSSSQEATRNTRNGLRNECFKDDSAEGRKQRPIPLLNERTSNSRKGNRKCYPEGGPISCVLNFCNFFSKLLLFCISFILFGILSHHPFLIYFFCFIFFGGGGSNHFIQGLSNNKARGSVWYFLSALYFLDQILGYHIAQ